MSRRVGAVLWPLGTAIVVIAAWHYAVVGFKVPTYLVPEPLSVLAALWSGLSDGSLWPHIWATFAEIVSGYAIGCGAAFLAAVLVNEFRLAERALYPLIVAIQAIPKVALAPVLLVWFGFEAQSKIILVALICFFPTFVNSFAGLKSCDRNLVDLYRAFGAGRWRILLAVKIPAAAGSIFAGLEISVVLALTGAVVAELIAARRGLGYVIASSGANFDVSLMFACIVVLAAIGIILTQMIKAVRRRVAFWDTGTQAIAGD
jgi:NitT/TauT family transport system permease protein